MFGGGGDTVEAIPNMLNTGSYVAGNKSRGIGHALALKKIEVWKSLKSQKL